MRDIAQSFEGKAGSRLPPRKRLIGRHKKSSQLTASFIVYCAASCVIHPLMTTPCFILFGIVGQHSMSSYLNCSSLLPVRPYTSCVSFPFIPSGVLPSFSLSFISGSCRPNSRSMFASSDSYPCVLSHLTRSSLSGINSNRNLKCR